MNFPSSGWPRIGTETRPLETPWGAQGSDQPQGLSLEGLLEYLQQKQTPEAADLIALLRQILALLEGLMSEPESGGPEPAAGAEAAPPPSGEAPAGPAAGGHATSEGSERVDGPGGFLWKPVSESDGNLVVLLPPNLRGKVESVDIVKDGRVIESGRFSGDQKNGGRPHFRFSKPGGSYGNGVEVVAKLKGGETARFPIKRGGARND